MSDAHAGKRAMPTPPSPLRRRLRSQSSRAAQSGAPGGHGRARTPDPEADAPDAPVVQRSGTPDLASCDGVPIGVPVGPLFEHSRWGWGRLAVLATTSETLSCDRGPTEPSAAAAASAPRTTHLEVSLACEDPTSAPAECTIRIGPLVRALASRIPGHLPLRTDVRFSVGPRGVEGLRATLVMPLMRAAAIDDACDALCGFRHDSFRVTHVCEV